MTRGTYRVKWARGGDEFEAEGDKAFVLAMLAKYGPSGEAAPVVSGVQASKPSTKAAAGTKSLSLGEFIRQLALKKHTDIVLAFGYYLEKYQGLNDFTSADINRAYYEAKLESSNTSQMLVQNIKRGTIMEVPGSKKGSKQRRYTLTQTGEDKIRTFLAKAK